MRTKLNIPSMLAALLPAGRTGRGLDDELREVEEEAEEEKGEGKNCVPASWLSACKEGGPTG